MSADIIYIQANAKTTNPSIREHIDSDRVDYSTVDKQCGECTNPGARQRVNEDI